MFGNRAVHKQENYLRESERSQEGSESDYMNRDNIERGGEGYHNEEEEELLGRMVGLCLGCA